MVCDTCQHDNQPNAKFCTECGAAFSRACPSCGRQQPAVAKFCDECGTSLTAPPPPSTGPPPAASRKRVTALFADLVGSTAFAERLDPEAVRAGLVPYFELLQSTIDDHAGTVVKFLGDGMLALFGVPEIAEDDALRAVTAGVELQRRFRSLAAEIRDRHGVELGLRVGVNTGELVIGEDDVDLVGDVLNTASRIESACEPGHVLVGEDTWRLTRSSVPYSVLGEVRVKGKSEPVATFQVVEGGADAADKVTPFVGRGGELDVLRVVFADAVASSTARLVTVIGEPGVGKTRLAQELRSGSEARSFDLRLERRGSTTFTPIADLLRDVTASGTLDDIERLVGGHAEAARLGQALASFLGHGEPRTTEESFWAVRRLLELLAGNGPVIVVVDDIQWAEPLFWDLLDHLVEWTAAPVLLVALARPELRELRPELTQPGRRVSAALALNGLDAATTLELAARMLGIDELPAELAERLPTSTDGNPLFVRELVQMLVDDGVLARDGDRWRLTIDADAIEVPPTILSLLASRVERLPDDERLVVELASVVGTEFDRGTLTAIAPGEVATRLGAVIDRLRRKDLIEATGQWAGDHPVYRFHHVLIRDAAYRRLLKGHRAELHERVGRHVETSGISDDECDVIVAHHFEQVFQYRSDLGAVDDRTRGLAVEAAGRLRSVAEQALDREDLAAAGNAAIRALRLLGGTAGADHDDLLLIGCEALLSSADVTRGAQLVDELHARSTDPRLAAWADCFRAQLWSLTAADRLTEAGELAADAAGRLAALGDDSGVAKARLVRAGCLARLGRVGDCEAELDLALGAARAAGDRRRTVAVLGAAPLAALWGPSPIARAGGRCLDVLRLLRITTASPTVEATSIRCQGMLEALRGRHDAACAKFETSRAMAQELGLRHALYETELFAGLAELLVGDACAAEPHLRAAHEGLGRLGIGADAGQAAALLARSLLLQGRVVEADDLASTALDTAGQNLQTAIAARAALAEVRAAQGRRRDAQTLADDALSMVTPTDVTLDHALTLLAAARVALARGDAAAAARHRRKADEQLAAKGATVAFHEPVPAGPIDDEPTPDATPSAVPAAHRMWNDALEIAQRSADFATAGDRASFTACYSPDLTFATHRPLPTEFGFGSAQGATTWADFIEWLLSHSDDRVATVEPIAIRGRHHALYRTRIGSASGVLDRLVVMRGDGHVIVEAHFYEPDQLVDAIDELDRQWTQHDPSADAATARFHQLTPKDLHQRPFTNTAWEVGQLATEAFAPGEHQVRLVAIRGDHLALTWNRLVVEGAEQFVRYRVNETVGRLLIGVEWFDEDQLDEAVAELDRRYLLSQGFAADHWIVTAWSRTYGTTGDEVLPYLHPDVEFVEHRRFHQLSGGAEDLLRSADAPNQGSAMVTQVFRVTERGAVFERVETEPNAPGQAQILMVLVFADERIRHLEVFDTDALDEALARYDELTAGLAQHELANTASRLAIALTAAQDEQDSDRMAALLSPDFTIRAHGRWAEWFPQVSGPEFVTVIETEVGQGARVIDVVALRGEHLSLLRRTHQLVSGLETDARMFLVATDDERILSIDWYQDGQDAEAFAELDRRFLAAQGFRNGHWLVEGWRAAYATGVDEVAPYLHPDVKFVEHRRFIAVAGGAGELLAMAQANATGTATVPRVFRLSERGAVYERLEVEAGAPGEMRMIMVLGFAGDKVRYVETFDPDELDAALARYDEIVGVGASPPAAGRVQPNRAYRIADEFGRAVVRRDRVGMLELLAEDFESDHRGSARETLGGVILGSRSEFVDRLLTWAAKDRLESFTRTPVAIRGDDLYLAASTQTTIDGDELLNYTVGQSDGNRLLRVTYFDESQLGDAFTELDRRYRLACGIDDDHWVAKHWDTLTSFDADRYDEIFTPDFQSFDHRAFTLGLTGRDEFLAWVRATPASSTWSVPVIHRLDDRAIVLEHAEMWADETGESRMLAVVEFGGGLTTRVDTYDIDDLDAALARYDEITGAPRRALTNASWESARRRQAAQSRQDRAGFAAMFDADFVAEFHDPLMTGALGTAQFDKPGFMELVLHPDMTNEGAGSDMALIAIRGDDLCLYRVGMTSPGGDLTERLIVDATHDGRCIRMDIFDPDQLIDAQLVLDRWYRRTCGIGDDHWLAAAASSPYTTDFTGLQWFLHPDFEYIERRPLAWPSGDSDNLRAYMATYGAVPELVVRTVHRLSERGIVYERLERTDDESVTDVVMVCHFQDERMRRLISYEPENLDQALAEFDEFVARPPVRALTNAAWEIVQDAHLVKISGNRDRYEAFFTDDFVVTTHDSIMAQVHGGTYDKALWMEAAFDPLVFGPTSNQNVELVAVRSDDLCLFRSRVTTETGDLHERLNLLEVSDGLAARMDVFAHDQLREAQIALDRAWLASLGLVEDHPWFELVGLLYVADSTVIGQALSEDFIYLDHRRLGWPDGDKSQVMTNQDTHAEPVEIVIPRFLRLSDRLTLGERIEQTVGGDQSGGLYLAALGPDGRITYMEIFDVDDEAAAIARYDSLLAEMAPPEPSGPAIPPLTNRAWELATAFTAAYAEGDRDALDRLVDPAGTVESRGRLDPLGTVSGRDFLDFRLAIRPADDDGRRELELIAVRGERLCLARVDRWLHGALARLPIVVETDDEHITRLIWFDDDQLVDAQLELDRLWFTSIGFAGHWSEPVRLSLYDPRPDAMLALLAPDFEYEDHRPLMFGTADAEQLRSIIDSMEHATVFTVPRIHRMSEAGSVIERIETATGEIGQTHVVFVAQFVDHRIQRMEAFDITELDQALARYDELTGG